MAAGLVLSTAALSIAVACGDDDAENRPCPVNDAACSAAVSLEGQLDDGAVAELVSRSRADEHVCPGPVATAHGEPFPLCNGATVGEVRTGYTIANDSAYLVLSEEAMAARFEEVSGATGGPDWRVVSLACPAAGGGSRCQDKVLVGLAQLTPSGEPVPEAGAMLMELALDGGEWEIVLLTQGFFFGYLDLVLEGGDLPAEPPHAAFEGFASVTVWRPR